MANEEHLALLKQGVEIWNQWRHEHESIVPDISGANLIGAILSGANLSKANLSKANLSETNLIGANLSGANLRNVDLRSADLRGANLSKANLRETNLMWASLSGAELSGAELSGANLSRADLRKANLSGASLSRANLTKSNFIEVNFDDMLNSIKADPSLRAEMSDTTIRDTVQFTAYYPRDAKVNTRYSFLLYAHTTEAFEEVRNDVEKFTNELGNKAPPPKTAKQTTQIRLDTPITVVPECDQIEFDPPSLTKKWSGEWTRFGFDFKPTQAMSGDTLFIRVSVQVATVEVAHINCAVEVTEEKTESPRHIAYFPRILILTFRDYSPSRNVISQALLFSGGHAKSSQLRVAPLKGDNI